MHLLAGLKDGGGNGVALPVRRGLGNLDADPIHLDGDGFDGLGFGLGRLACHVRNQCVGVRLSLAWLVSRAASSEAPRASKSSLNFLTKLKTGHEQASPKAQMVRP